MLPTARSSISGFFFILLGAVAGAMFGTIPLVFGIQENSVRMNLFTWLMLGMPLFVGAWLGSYLHRSVGGGLAWARRRHARRRRT